MFQIIDAVLTPAELEQVRGRLATMTFVDGASSAGWNARLVKNNTQAQPSPDHAHISRLVLEAITRHPDFHLGVRPQRIRPLQFSRYVDGMAYGDHLDSATMDQMRVDVSFTLFLCDPATYDGGELVVQDRAGDRVFKLKPGQALAYPSTTLHRVEPVTRGERLAAVGWCQSLVRDPAHREILYDLEIARRTLFDKDGKTREFDLLSKALVNLVRMWTEI